MQLITLLLVLIASAMPIFGNEPPDALPVEIRVQLATDSSLTPIYLSHIQSQQTAFDAAYLNELENVLLFDLNYNSSTKVLPRQDQREKLLQNQENTVAFDTQVWKGYGVPHVIKAVVSGNTLTLSLFSTATGTLKHFKDIPLRGSLAEDRRQIHRAADALYKALFNKEGVASTQILYSVQVKNPKTDGTQWLAEIWQCDWDGANAHPVTKEGSYCINPVFVPHSERIPPERFVYVSYKTGQPKIFIASLQDGKGKRLIQLQGNQFLPAISRQRDKIAFICDAAGRSDLFIQPIDAENGEPGKPLQLFSAPRASQASPTFNPDGSKVAFVSDKDGSARIYIMSTVPSEKKINPTLLTKQNSESSCPMWSPDGTKLAYSAKTKGTRQIWLYDFEAREERQLTDGPGNKENPVWAKDSVHLVFNSTDGATSELYLVNLNQPEAIKITKGPGKKHYPTW